VRHRLDTPGLGSADLGSPGPAVFDHIDTGLML
jgi:hypothetical protein